MSSRVIVSLRVAATTGRAFEVFTRDIGAWWQPNDLFRFTPRSPGRIALEAGEGGRLTETLANGTVFEIGRVTGWEPGARLALTWRQATFAPDQLTHVEVLFEAVADETRVTVTHTGWDSVPQATRCAPLVPGRTVSAPARRVVAAIAGGLQDEPCPLIFSADAAAGSRHTCIRGGGCGEGRSWWR